MPQRSSSILKFVILALIATSAMPAAARDIYVNNVAGDDLFDGTSPQSADLPTGPFRSLRRALKAANAGDRIIFARNDEPYHESVSLVGSFHSGSSSFPFIIEGQGAIFDGTKAVNPDAWQFVSGDTFRFQPERKQYQILYLDGAGDLRKPAPTEPGRMPDLEPREWAMIGGYIYFRVEHGRLPQEYNLRYTHLSAGITLYKVEGVIIHDLVLQGYALDGIDMHDTRGPCLLSGLNCRGNARSGVAVVGAAKGDLSACLLADNGLCQLLVDGYSGCNISNCDVIPASAPKWKVGENSELRIDGQLVNTKPQ